jgi:phenylpyruvate tautomerase PptA (4-oxalocrotonate tautomerase family)
MPVTQITLLPGYSPEVRERLVARVSHAVASVIAAPPAGITTFINEAATYQRDARVFVAGNHAHPVATEVVKAFLAAMQARELDRAQAFLAPGFQMQFPGGVRFTTLQQLVDWGRQRYRSVGKTFEAFDEAWSGTTSVVHCHGTLSGEWPDRVFPRPRLQSRSLTKADSALVSRRKLAGTGDLTTWQRPPRQLPRQSIKPSWTNAPNCAARRLNTTSSPPPANRHCRHQAADQPARPVAGLFARRGRPLRRDRQGPEQRLQVHQPRQPGGRDHQRHRRAGAGRHRAAGVQAGHGRQGRAVQEVRRVDVFDIEINEKDPDKLVEVIAALEPTFGAINLEDIKAPDCFYVERELRKRMKIPVFHDDQHGTAITVGAAMLNGLKVVGKDISQVKLVTSGAGAAALACLNLLLKLGLKRENVFVTDLAGVVYEGRTELMDEDKIQYAQKTNARTLAEVMNGADVFLGLSAGGVLKPDMVATMAAKPVIFALANPNPEIARRRHTPCATTPSWPRAAPTTPTRSTTSCAFRTSSAARWIRARPPSRTKWKLQQCTPLPSWPRPSKAKWWPRPMPARSWRSALNT